MIRKLQCFRGKLNKLTGGPFVAVCITHSTFYFIYCKGMSAGEAFAVNKYNGFVFVAKPKRVD